MNILITGGTGFIGTHLVKELCNHHQLHVLVPPDLDFIIPENVKVIEFSDDIPLLHAYLIENKIEGIVHLATLFIAQHQGEQIKNMVLSNIYLGTAILEAVRATSVQWFLNTGTIWQNYKSDSVDYCPVNLYAATKQAFIDMAAFYIETSDLKFATLKLSDTFGGGDTRRKLFTVLKEAAISGEELRMSPGEQYLDILYISDIISGFVHLIHLLHDNKLKENDYVLTAHKRYTLKEVIAIFEKVSGKKLNVVWGGREYRKREVMQPWKKGKVLPGWNAQLSLEQGITLYLNENENAY